MLRVQISPPPKIFFNSNQQKISLWKSEQKKKGTLSLIASVRAVAVGEEEETRKERERSGGIIKRKKWRHHLKHQYYVGAPSDSICVILTTCC